MRCEVWLRSVRRIERTVQCKGIIDAADCNNLTVSMASMAVAERKIPGVLWNSRTEQFEWDA